jgi:hypothetical protein
MSENEPMRSDPTETPAAEPLTLAETKTLRAPTRADFHNPHAGDTVRVVDKTGRVAQGLITCTSGHRTHEPTEFKVAGATWASSWATFYRAPTGAPEIVAAPMALTADALRDLIADISGELTARGQVQSVTLDSIARRALGYDPSVGRSGAQFGGKSKVAWCNEHFSLSKAKKAAAELCSAGILREVKYGTYDSPSAERPYVHFSYGSKVGWVLESMYEAAQVAVGARQDTAGTAKLLAQARQNVADRHADEVQAELRVLQAAAAR